MLITSRLMLVSLILDYLSYINHYNSKDRSDNEFLTLLEKIMKEIFAGKRLSAIKTLLDSDWTLSKIQEKQKIQITSPNPERKGIQDYLVAARGFDHLEFDQGRQKKMSLLHAKLIIDLLSEITEETWKNLP